MLIYRQLSIGGAYDAIYMYFVLGTVVSIPIAVFAPFVTNRILQRQGERNSRQAEKRNRQLAAERAVIERFVADPSAFTHYLLSRVLFITLVTSFTEILPNVVNVIGNGFGAYGESIQRGNLAVFFGVQGWLATLSGLLWVISLAIVIPIASRAIKMYNHVAHHDSYIKYIEMEISRLHMEPAATELPEIGNASTPPSQA